MDRCVNRWVDVFMHRLMQRMGRWVSGWWMDERVYVYMNGGWIGDEWVDELTVDGWIIGSWMDTWMYEWVGACLSEWLSVEWMDAFMPGCMDGCVTGWMEADEGEIGKDWQGEISNHNHFVKPCPGLGSSRTHQPENLQKLREKFSVKKLWETVKCGFRVLTFYLISPLFCPPFLLPFLPPSSFPFLSPPLPSLPFLSFPLLEI